LLPHPRWDTGRAESARIGAGLRPDRLSALDAAFLDLDRPVAPLHVGWTLRFEGRAPALAALRRRRGARGGDAVAHARPGEAGGAAIGGSRSPTTGEQNTQPGAAKR
jgi:hypothetical protein